MKKLISLMLVLVMAFAMVACAQPAATTEEPAAEEGAATEETAAPAEEGKKLKLGFILGSREHAFYCSIEDGIKAAADELGFEAVVLESDLKGDIASQRIEDLRGSGSR